MAEMKTDPSFQFKKPIIPCTSNISFRPIDLLCNQRFGDMCFNLSPKTCMKGIVTWGYAYNILQPKTTNVNHHHLPIKMSDSDREKGDILHRWIQVWQLICCLVMYSSRSMRKWTQKIASIKNLTFNPSHFAIAAQNTWSLRVDLSLPWAHALVEEFRWSAEPNLHPFRGPILFRQKTRQLAHEFLSLVGSDQNWKMVTLWIGWTIGFCLGICLE